MPSPRVLQFLSVRFLLGVLASVAMLPVLGGEWANWRGPYMNGTSDETGLISSWSVGGENLIWRDDFTGRSTPVVFNGRACAIGRVGLDVLRQETVVCWSAETGERLWERRFTVHNTFVPWNRLGWGSVAGDPETGYLYINTSDGLVAALDDGGVTVWSYRMGEDFDRKSGYGGRTHTPIVDEDRVILGAINSGWGKQGLPSMRYWAFDKKTGEVLWVSQPAGKTKDMNIQSTPVIAVVDGERLLIGGNSDGSVYAIRARTGEKLWGFTVSKVALNASVAVADDAVFISHSEENVNSSIMGRAVAINTGGSGDVTATHERWRIEGLKAGYSTPLVHGDRVYILDNQANLHAIDMKTGQKRWSHNIGTVGKSGPVWADGKIYVTEVNGRFHILRDAGDRAEVLDSEKIMMPDGARVAEIYSSPAVAYGRIYFATEEGMYCLGNRSRPFSASGGPVVDWGERLAVPGAVPALVQVVPAEVVASTQDKVRFRLRSFDASGHYLGDVEASSWSVEGLQGTVGKAGELSVEPLNGLQVGHVVARFGNLEARARVRAGGPLPWSENFEDIAVGGYPETWLGKGKKAHVEEFEGGHVLVQPNPKSFAPRAVMYIGPSSLSGYTIQADIRATVEGRRRPELGLINSGYTFMLQGVQQRMEIRSWGAELRMMRRQDFAWEMDTWYTLKLRVDYENGPDGERAVILGKAWKRGQAEPADWTMTAHDPLPIRSGAPGLYAFTPVAGYFDNVKITSSENVVAAKPVVSGSEVVMFGAGPSRNMAGAATGLPAEWDLNSGKNIKWKQPVGSQTYAGPVILGGKVFVGTNNEGLRNPKLTQDRGVVMAFDEKTGKFLWQMTHEKLPESKLHDWPLQGVCSTPAIEGDRLYYVSNRAEVVALDTEGFLDGENDGPFKSETETSPIDGDVVWSYDLMAELDVFPHNLAAGSPLLVGDIVYASTGTGVDEAHINVPVPYAPSIVAMNKNTGELVWDNASPGESTLHGTWSNPSYGVIQGRAQVIFPSGDGWVYSFEPQTGEILWKFDANPKDSKWILGGAGTRNNIIGMGVIYDDKVYVGVGQDPEHGEAPGHFYAIDATLSGDITDRGVVWQRSGEDFHRTISTAAIVDDIVYISDLSGFLYMLNAQTGEHYCTYDAFAAIWGSAYVADGKVYLGDEDGDVAVLDARPPEGSKECTVLAEINMGAAVYTTPLGHDGTLFVLSRSHLFAIEEGAK